jgi:uncharacterized membrane-anchored protein
MLETVNSASSLVVTCVIIATVAVVAAFFLVAVIKKGLVAGIVTIVIGGVAIYALSQVFDLPSIGNDIAKEAQQQKAKIVIPQGN